MIKSCRFCRYCYLVDEEDVSGLNCEKHKLIRIICPDELHPMCNMEYKFSWLHLIFGI